MTQFPANPNRLLIVDGHAYAYRAFYAIRQLSSPTGQATNAIYGFIKMLGKMVNWVKPSHLLVVWDGGLAEERMALWPDYKVQRPAMPDSLETQLDEITSYLEAASISSFCREGIEADDWIATITKQAVQNDIDVIIASADKDFMQLVGEHVWMLNPNEKEERLWGPEEVVKKTGVPPSKICDYLCLLGDNVDNIPGVPGVGPKTAADLINQFGSVDEIYKRLPEVSSERLRTNLAQSEAAVRRNQKLICLNEDMPCDFSPQILAVKNGNYERLKELFSGWGFRTLLQELEKTQTAPAELL